MAEKEVSSAYTLYLQANEARLTEEGLLAALVPPRIRDFMRMTEFTVETITAACDWSGDNYIPLGVTASFAPASETPMTFTLSCGDQTLTASSCGEAVCFRNLLAGRTYTLTLTDGAGKEAASPLTFATEMQTPRTLYIPGTDNTRDIGGRLTADGKHRVRQGRVLRGANLRTMTPAQLKVLTRDLGVKTELDLTGGGESSDAVAAVMHREFHSIKWYNLIFSEPDYLPALRDALRLFADADKYPFYIHCSLGRDRTGAIAYFLNALCGVPEADLFREHLLTFFSRRGDGENAGVQAHLNNIFALHDCTMQTLGRDHTPRENAEAFLLSIGLTAEELARIRENLLEDA